MYPVKAGSERLHTYVLTIVTLVAMGNGELNITRVFILYIHNYENTV